MASCFQHVSSMFGMMLARLTSMSLREKCLRWKWPCLSVVIASTISSLRAAICAGLLSRAGSTTILGGNHPDASNARQVETASDCLLLWFIMLMFDLTCHSRRTPDTPIFNPLCNPFRIFRHSFLSLCFTCDAAAKVNGLIPWAVWSRFPGQPHKPSLLLGSTWFRSVDVCVSSVLMVMVFIYGTFS